MSEDEKGALILVHLQNEGACSLGKTLVDRGFRTKTVNVSHEDLNDIDPLRPELLVIMGAPIGVYQKDDYPFLEQEIEIVKTRLAADKPTIGICLGSQLIAAALGARVYKGDKGKEIGWSAINVTKEGQNTPVRHLDASQTRMFQWHGDTFDFPEGATLLATSDQYENQIFQSGKNALALQCHPEVRANLLNEWFVMLTHQITGENPLISIDELRAQTKEHVGTLNTQASLFFNEWLEDRGL